MDIVVNINLNGKNIQEQNPSSQSLPFRFKKQKKKNGIERILQLPEITENNPSQRKGILDILGV